MGKWFQHCWEGTAAALCCWRMTDFLFSLPLTHSLLCILSPLFLSLYSFSLTSAFLFLVSLSAGPYFSGSCSLSHLLCTAGSSHHRACEHTQTRYTQLHAGECNSQNTFPGILVQGILIVPFHVSAIWKKKKKKLNMLSANRVEQSMLLSVCMCVLHSMSQLCPNVTIGVSRGYTVKLSIVS